MPRKHPLFRPDGTVKGISFSPAIPPHAGSTGRGQGFRVLIGGCNTLFGITLAERPDEMEAVYARAVDRLLAALGEGADVRERMLQAYPLFLARYSLTIEPVAMYRLTQNKRKEGI